MISGLVLAAGASARMGRPKMLLPLGGETVLGACVRPLLEAGLQRVVVVLGCRAEDVRRLARLPSDPRLEVVVNEEWHAGMSSSLRRGLAACRDADAILVALGDQPGVTAELVRSIVTAIRPDRPLVVPLVGDRTSHPVLFASSLFGEISDLRGDLGAREVVRRHWTEASFVEGLPLHDLDTEEDYRGFLEGRAARDAEGFRAPDLPWR